MGVPANVLQALADAAAQFGRASIQWPIQLTPKAPFHTGVAALVFVSPHLLSPADDVAEFGIRNPPPLPGEDLGIAMRVHLPPYDGAHVVAWLRPPELSREYNVEFNCQGVTGDTFVLEQPDGSEETAEVSNASEGVNIGKLTLSSNVQAQEHEWLRFGVTSGAYWRFVSCEISMLPTAA